MNYALKKMLEPLPPQEGETPFFVLLDDDRQVSHLEVETDDALAGNDENPADESFVRMVITVETRAYYATMFNMGFSLLKRPLELFPGLVIPCLRTDSTNFLNCSLGGSGGSLRLGIQQV